jgi:hypothetical protein
MRAAMMRPFSEPLTLETVQDPPCTGDGVVVAVEAVVENDVVASILDVTRDARADDADVVVEAQWRTDVDLALQLPDRLDHRQRLSRRRCRPDRPRSACAAFRDTVTVQRPRPGCPDVPHLRRQPDVGELGGDEFLGVAFAPHQARRPHERAQQLELMLPARLDRTAQVHGRTVAHSGA